jgi:hypothetical protein
MRQLAKRLAAWWDAGYVRWHLPLGNGWQISGRFSNCVSKKCLMRRVKRILDAPVEPPSRVYRLADTALDYLAGLIHDAELDSYEVRLGVDSGEDRRGKAMTDLIVAKLTGGAVVRKAINDEDGVGRFPDIFLGIRLMYDAYDCLDSGELCEGWWLEVVAEYDVESEWCSARWSRYVGVDKHIDVDAVLRAAQKALRHAYNAKT